MRLLLNGAPDRIIVPDGSPLTSFQESTSERKFQGETEKFCAKGVVEGTFYSSVSNEIALLLPLNLGSQPLDAALDVLLVGEEVHSVHDRQQRLTVVNVPL